MREDRPSLGGRSFCYVNVPQRRVHGGRKKHTLNSVSIIFSPTEDYQEMQPAKYSNILSAFMKIELCQFTFGAIHFEHSKKRGAGAGWGGLGGGGV